MRDWIRLGKLAAGALTALTVGCGSNGDHQDGAAGATGLAGGGTAEAGHGGSTADAAGSYSVAGAAGQSDAGGVGGQSGAGGLGGSLGSSGAAGNATAGNGGSHAGSAGSGGSSDGVTLDAATLPDARVNNSYTFALHARGGSGGYTFSLSDGALPDGITLTSDGTIRGLATTEATASFTAQVTDSAGATSVATYSLRVGLHRWVAYQWYFRDDSNGVDGPFEAHTSLQDLSSLSANAVEPSECAAATGVSSGPPAAFSPDGSWFACANSVFDARNAVLGTSTTLPCSSSGWSPEANIIICVNGSKLGFVDVRAPDDDRLFSMPSGCTLDGRAIVWSPGGQLLAFTCDNGASYVVSPHWAARPLVPLSVGNYGSLRFVSDQVLTFVGASENLTYSRVTEGSITSPVELNQIQGNVPSAFNPANERAVYDYLMVDFKAGTVTSGYAMSPDLSYFLKLANGEVSVYADPAQAPVASVSGVTEIGPSSPDGHVLVVATSDASAGLLWLTPSIHLAPLGTWPYGGIYTLGEDGTFGVLNVGGQLNTFSLDSSQASIPINSGSFSWWGGTNDEDTPTVISPTQRAFVYTNCIATVDVTGEPHDMGCSPVGTSFAAFGGREQFWLPNEPFEAWSSDSSVALFLSAGIQYANPGSPTDPAQGLIAMRVADTQHPKELVAAIAGTFEDYIQTVTWYQTQP